MTMEKTRCFISLNLPEEIINKTIVIQNDLKSKNLFSGKYTLKENTHLTLKFLGEITDDQIEKTKTKLQNINFKNFSAIVPEIGVFSKKQIRIIWLKLNSKEVIELQKQIDSSLKNIFRPESRFMSHITIARVKDTPNKEKLLSRSRIS